MASSESTSKKTLFVRNIPYSTKDADLEAVFSEYGPLKSCFTVKDKGEIIDIYGGMRRFRCRLRGAMPVEKITLFCDCHSMCLSVFLTSPGVADKCRGFGYVVFADRCVCEVFQHVFSLLTACLPTGRMLREPDRR